LSLPKGVSDWSGDWTPSRRAREAVTRRVIRDRRWVPQRGLAARDVERVTAVDVGEVFHEREIAVAQM
jgi:hypothetical protein